MTTEYFLPQQIDGEIISAAATATAIVTFTTEEFEIPYYVSAWHVSCLADTDGSLNVQQYLNSAWTTFDSVPVTANVELIRNYAFNVGKTKLEYEHSSTAAATLTLHIDTTQVRK